MEETRQNGVLKTNRKRKYTRLCSKRSLAGRLTGSDQRKRRMKITKQTRRRRPRKYHFDFFQMMFLNVRNGEENQRNEVTGRLDESNWSIDLFEKITLTEELLILDCHWVSLVRVPPVVRAILLQWESPIPLRLSPEEQHGWLSTFIACLSLSLTVSRGWPSWRSTHGHQPFSCFMSKIETWFDAFSLKISTEHVSASFAGLNNRFRSKVNAPEMISRTRGECLWDDLTEKVIGSEFIVVPDLKIENRRKEDFRDVHTPEVFLLLHGQRLFGRKVIELIDKSPIEIPFAIHRSTRTKIFKENASIRTNR